jgi:tyrosyl-tRNA synthetase
MPADMPEVVVHCAEDAMPLVQLLKQSGLTPSTSEALRMIEQGGVRLNGERVADKSARVPRGETVVAQVGKRKFARVSVK